MNKEVLTREELIDSIRESVSQITQLISSMDEQTINKIPYANSWNAGQLVRHVSKSIAGMGSAMLADVPASERDPAEKIHQLKETFLNFSNKMNSPDFILPEDENYNASTSVEELNQAFELLQKNSSGTDLKGLLTDLPFGPTTKLELLHFILFHTARHLHQLRRIMAA